MSINLKPALPGASRIADPLTSQRRKSQESRDLYQHHPQDLPRSPLKSGGAKLPMTPEKLHRTGVISKKRVNQSET